MFFRNIHSGKVALAAVKIGIIADKAERGSLPGVFLMVVTILLAACPAAIAQQEDMQESELKSVFLFNFLKYMEWPAGYQFDVIAVDILGDEQIYNAFNKIAELKTIKSKKIVVRKIDSVDQIGPCHILFIDETYADALDEIIQRTQQEEIILVGDLQGLAERGVAINFVKIRGKIRFEINVAVFRDLGVKVSSNLMKLAILVDGEE